MNRRVNYVMVVTAIAFAFVTQSCSTDDDGDDIGNWTSRSVFDGAPRSSAASFVIDNIGYVGTGYDGDDYLTDFWSYDIAGDFWVQKADFPGIARSSAVGFSVSSTGYIGTGYDADSALELDDFWAYNPSSNSWTQKADFSGGNRRGAVAFAAGDKGYLGTGFDGDNDRKDFWEYSPTTDEWTEVFGYGGSKRRYATTFSIDDKVYLVTGVNNGLYVEDVWEFTPATGVWDSKNDLDYDEDYYITRSNALGFSLNGYGYVSCGYSGGVLGSTWQYNPGDDTWEQLTSLEATSRQDAVSFTSANNQAFVLLGRSGSLYLDDNYEFFPQEELNEDD